MTAEERVRAFFSGDLPPEEEPTMRRAISRSRRLRALYDDLAALERLLEGAAGGRAETLASARAREALVAALGLEPSWLTRLARRVGAVLADGLTVWQAQVVVRRPALAGAKDARPATDTLGEFREGDRLQFDFLVPEAGRYAVLHVDEDGEGILHPGGPDADVPIAAGQVLRLAGQAEGRSAAPRALLIMRVPDDAPPVTDAAALLAYAAATPAVAVRVHPYHVVPAVDA